MKIEKTDQFQIIPIDAIRRNPSNPRGAVKWDDVKELAESIRIHGILQPLVVQPNGELIAGERRFVAAMNLGLDVVPVIVRTPIDGHESEELALVENVQRENLKPSVEAKAYLRMKARGLSVAEISDKTGILKSKIYALIQLAELPVDVQAAVDEGKLSISSIKELYKFKDVEKRDSAIHRAIEEGLTGEEVKAIVRDKKPPIGATKVSYSVIVNRAIDKIEEARLLLERFDEYKFECQDLFDVKQELHSQSEKLLRIEEDIVNAMAEKLSSKSGKIATDDFVKTDYTRQFTAAIF